MRSKKAKSFRILPGFAVYVPVLALSVLFTQFLRNRVSNMFLWFVVLIPFISLAHALLGKAFVQSYVTSSVERTEKNAPSEYEIRIINSSFLPYPFVEALLSEPSDSAARCEGFRVLLSLVPFGGYIVKKEISFKYRGYYEIGVDMIYIRDFLGIFEVGKRVTNFVSVSVSPRILKVGDRSGSALTDAPSVSPRRFDLSEKTDVADIRDYTPGDSVKDIHWKLSSKSEEIKVKEFSSDEKKHVYILCDLARATHAPEGDTGKIYDELKRAVLAQKKERKKKVKVRDVADSAVSERLAKGASILGDLRLAVAEKRRRSKYRKNIKSGMSRENAEMAEMIDSLIRDSKRRRVKNPKKSRGPIDDSADAPDVTFSDIERILDTVKSTYPEEDISGSAYGGRVRAECLEDHDEFCADAVCEIALSTAQNELKDGNRTTLVWFDSREDGGVAAVDIASRADLEGAAIRLGSAKCVPAGSYVSSLSGIISEQSGVSLKAVTSNIDPVSLDELARIPDSFGGAGGDCVCRVLLFSPEERFESPKFRSAYVDEAASRLLHRGVMLTEVKETEDKYGEPTLEAIIR